MNRATTLTARNRRRECLYAAVARGRTDDLPEPVRRFHFANNHVRAVGLLNVRHGSGLLARALARLLRFPRDGQHIEMHLSVIRDGHSEVWQRSFGGRTLTSRQYRSGSLLAERVGPLELLLRVDAMRGALVFATSSARLRFFDRSVVLPRSIAPAVRARITSQSAPDMHVAVTVSTPLTRELLTYCGTIREVTQ